MRLSSPRSALTSLSSARATVSISVEMLLTSEATTAKPLPAAPARDASISAFSASIFVCRVMLAMAAILLLAVVLSRATRSRMRSGSYVGGCGGGVGLAIGGGPAG